MRTCDICKKEMNRISDGTQLIEKYQVDNVKELCDECYSTLNSMSSKFESFMYSILQENKLSFWKKILRRLVSEKNQENK